jgi:hypothetical protein
MIGGEQRKCAGGVEVTRGELEEVYDLFQLPNYR